MAKQTKEQKDLIKNRLKQLKTNKILAGIMLVSGICFIIPNVLLAGILIITSSIWLSKIEKEKFDLKIGSK